MQSIEERIAHLCELGPTYIPNIVAIGRDAVEPLMNFAISQIKNITYNEIRPALSTALKALDEIMDLATPEQAVRIFGLCRAFGCNVKTSKLIRVTRSAIVGTRIEDIIEKLAYGDPYEPDVIKLLSEIGQPAIDQLINYLDKNSGTKNLALVALSHKDLVVDEDHLMRKLISFYFSGQSTLVENSGQVVASREWKKSEFNAIAVLLKGKATTDPLAISLREARAAIRFILDILREAGDLKILEKARRNLSEKYAKIVELNRKETGGIVIDKDSIRKLSSPDKGDRIFRVAERKLMRNG